MGCGLDFLGGLMAVMRGGKTRGVGVVRGPRGVDL